MSIPIVPEAASLAQHVQALRDQGRLAFSATPTTFWQGAEMRSLALCPPFAFDLPPRRQIRKALWQAKSPVATYVCHPDADHPQNAWLYVCCDQQYGLGKLDAAVRTNIRRAQRSLRFEFISDEALLEHGTKPFCDTRSRVGLSDGTLEAHREMCAAHKANPGRAVLGAWHEDKLAAFTTLVLVDDWVDIYSYADQDYLNLRPVNGLIHYVMDYFLVQRKFRLVSAGLSSIQEVSGAQGLHFFKKKVGFECWPVHRGVVFHPLLAPLANIATLQALRLLRRLRPGSPAIRKAAGLLSSYLGHNPMPPNSSTPEHEAETKEPETVKA